LLGLRRAEIEAYARAHRLAWVEDESNADVRHARNFLRHRILPVLEEGFPGSVPALGRAAAHFRDSGGLLDDLAALDAAACGGAMLERSSLLALSDERVRNLLRWRIHCAGVLAPDRSRLDEAVRQLREVSSDHPLLLSFGELACCVYRGQVWLEPVIGAGPEAIVWRGESELPWGNGAVRFEAVRGAGISRAALEAAREVLLTTRWAGIARWQASRAGCSRVG
jgi:tRNA(Ile)-lysidine synthase